MYRPGVQIVFESLDIFQVVMASMAAMRLTFGELAAGFWVFTVMAHSGVRNASHRSVSSNTHICLSTTFQVHAQDKAAIPAPAILSGGYFPPGLEDTSQRLKQRETARYAYMHTHIPVVDPFSGKTIFRNHFHG